MRQAGQIEAISPAKGTLSNIGQKHRRRKAFLGSESKFVSYVKLLCKLVYVNRLGGRRRIALRGQKRARYGMRSIHRVPYLALTDDHALYSPASSVFSPPVHFRDFHHGLFPPRGLLDRCAGVPALFPGPPAAQQPRRRGTRKQGGSQIQAALPEGRVSQSDACQPCQRVRSQSRCQRRW